MRKYVFIFIATLIICSFNVFAGPGRVFTNINTAGEYLRTEMKTHNEKITVGIETERNDYTELSREIYFEAVKYTGISDEGDYLRIQQGDCTATYTEEEIKGKRVVFFTYRLDYYTTLDEEEKVNKKIDEIVIEGDSNEEVIEAVFNYVKDNTEYSKEKNNSKRTAYAALVEGDAVCQGYALTMYRLLLENGIEARVVYGTSAGEPHAWNIVKCDGKYYYIDVTWDDVQNKSFKLKIKESFEKNHTMDEECAEEIKIADKIETNSNVNIISAILDKILNIF